MDVLWRLKAMAISAYCEPRSTQSFVNCGVCVFNKRIYHWNEKAFRGDEMFRRVDIMYIYDNCLLGLFVADSKKMGQRETERNKETE